VRPAAPGPQTARLPSWLQRGWRLIRKDIGRKLTALALALLAWGVLENAVVGEHHLDLEVQVVTSREQADRERLSHDAVYLVVPADLIVRDAAPQRIHLSVKGPRDDVTDLSMSAIVPFPPEMLGAEDEVQWTIALERNTFKSRSDLPQLTDFRLSSGSLTVTVARRAIAQLTLGSANVTLSGRPHDGFNFQESRIEVRPNVVMVNGPRRAIEKLRADATQLRLAAIDIDGRTSTVRQNVGLTRELLDAGVLLAPAAVEVTIFVVPEDVAIDLVSVPVIYRNAESLTAKKLRPTEATAALDIRVIGPPSELDRYRNQTALLAQKIALVFDWVDPAQPLQEPVLQRRAKVAVFKSGLSDAVRVVDAQKLDEPSIDYKLEPITGTP
jgi:hypothetical protein